MKGSWNKLPVIDLQLASGLVNHCNLAGGVGREEKLQLDVRDNLPRISNSVEINFKSKHKFRVKRW
jgi:hypothetical protein